MFSDSPEVDQDQEEEADLVADVVDVVAPALVVTAEAEVEVLEGEGVHTLVVDHRIFVTLFCC